jgi:hypothetical protein
MAGHAAAKPHEKQRKCKPVDRAVCCQQGSIDQLSPDFSAKVA